MAASTDACVPVGKSAKRLHAPRAAAPRASAVSSAAAASSIVQRARREQEARAVGQLVQRMRPRLELGHGADQQLLLRVRAPSFGATSVGEPRVVGLADIMAVEVLELLEVEARRRFADMVEVEPFDRLLAADDLVVAMAPAEPQQIIEQRLGQDAQLVAIGVDARARRGAC